MSKPWREAQKWERSWWGDCLNTYNEETKQYLYARYMGIKTVERHGVVAFDALGASVIDIGSGPSSMLLKTQTFTQAESSLVLPSLAVRARAVVVDPCQYPSWVASRYRQAGIEYWEVPAESLDLNDVQFDEAWIYNVLQHTKDPRIVIEKALSSANTLRIFEWVNTDVTDGHPHVMSKEILDEWIGREGLTVQLAGESSCYGTAYYGVF